jgi:hypothetical protein
MAGTSIDAGRALYNDNCIGCHGTPPNGLKIDLLAAANNPGLIRNQIQNNPAMQFLAPLTDADLANIATYIAYPVSNDADCVLGWGEVNYPGLMSPRTSSQTGSGYDYRYYPGANLYVGISLPAPSTTRHVYYLDAAGLFDLGDLSPYLAQALAAQCP